MNSFFAKLFGQQNNDNSLQYDVCLTFSEAKKELDRIGFAVIQIMDADTMQIFYNESILFTDEVYNKHGAVDFFAIGRSEFPEIRNASNEIVKKFLHQPLNSFLDSAPYDIIYGTHLLKSNNASSILNPHQDSSHVEEPVYSSFHFWMPVSTPTPDFGTLEVIPFSHRLEIPFRSLNIPWSLSEHEKQLWKFMKKIHLSSGQAVLFNSNLIHASGINTTDKMRIAVNSLIKPKEADFIHCYTDEHSDFQEIEMYKITPEFYYNEDIMKRPASYPLLKKVKNTNHTYSIQQLKTIFNANG